VVSVSLFFFLICVSGIAFFARSVVISVLIRSRRECMSMEDLDKEAEERERRERIKKANHYGDIETSQPERL